MNYNLLQVLVKSATVLVVVHHLVTVKHLAVVKKVKKLVAVAAFALVLRVDKLHCSVVFLNINRKEYAIVNLDQLNAFEDGAEVTPVVLIEAGIVKAEKSGIKILGNGELTKKLTVKAAKFSKSAEEAITAKGGSVEVI